MKGAKGPGSPQSSRFSPYAPPRGILTGNDPKRFEKVRTEQRNQTLIPRSESEGYLIVRVCRSRGPAGGPSSYRRCALGGNRVPQKRSPQVPSTTARVDNYEVLRDCLGGRTYVSQSPRRAARGALKNGGQDTHTQEQYTSVTYLCPMQCRM